MGEGGSGGGAISCFVLITRADKPDELIGCFLLLIARARDRDRAVALRWHGQDPSGQARIDVISRPTNYWTDTAVLFANDTALSVGGHPTT